MHAENCCYQSRDFRYNPRYAVPKNSGLEPFNHCMEVL